MNNSGFLKHLEEFYQPLSRRLNGLIYKSIRIDGVTTVVHWVSDPPPTIDSQPSYIIVAYQGSRLYNQITGHHVGHSGLFGDSPSAIRNAFGQYWTLKSIPPPTNELGDNDEWDPNATIYLVYE